MAQTNGERLLEYVNIDQVGADSAGYIQDKARDLGFGDILDYFNEESTVEEYKPKPKETIKKNSVPVVASYWDTNKKWLQPTLIGGGALAVVFGVVVASTK